MFRGGDYIGVGLSGGKDSAALLYALKKLYPDKKFVAIHIHHGIGEYSEDSVKKAKELCEILDVELQVYKLVEDMLETPKFVNTKYGIRICATCGMIRRWSLARAAKEIGVDILATGHNLDDTVEVMLSLFLAGDFEQLRRLKPVLRPEHPSQVWKIKPLIKSPERDNYIYALYNELPIRSVSCPYYRSARSIKMKRWLDEWEKHERDIKFKLFSIFTKKLIPILDKSLPEIEYKTCKICGGPSIGDICGVCRRKQFISELKQS